MHIIKLFIRLSFGYFFFRVSFLIQNEWNSTLSSAVACNRSHILNWVAPRICVYYLNAVCSVGCWLVSQVDAHGDEPSSPRHNLFEPWTLLAFTVHHSCCSQSTFINWRWWKQSLEITEKYASEHWMKKEIKKKQMKNCSKLILTRQLWFSV